MMKDTRKTIFVVDDSDTNLSTAEEVLEDSYDIMTIPSATRMFTLLEKIQPHLILLDIEMPQTNGFEAMVLLKSNPKYSDIPVIFLTSLSDVASEVRGFELGVVDFIIKPFSAPVLLNRVKMHLSVDQLLRERTARLEKAHKDMIFVLSDIVENRDLTTGGHIERTTEYIRIVGEAMIERGVYAEELKTWDMDVAVASSLLHDVGKIGVSDLILNKPGKLTPEEFEIMKSHVKIGEKIIDQIIERTGEDDFLKNAKLFASYHHENWDGTGYPYGIAGDEIPLQGRIMAIGDVYDALISVRPYKKAFTDEEAVDIILSESGRRFDPKIIEVFSDIRDQFRATRTAWERGELREF
ncbi:MAG: response regulator [Defluviitaleaceae bacterium]|nr:response regulator [Defluviitaleaceae bacterium]